MKAVGEREGGERREEREKELMLELERGRMNRLLAAVLRKTAVAIASSAIEDNGIELTTFIDSEICVQYGI